MRYVHVFRVASKKKINPILHHMMQKSCVVQTLLASLMTVLYGLMFPAESVVTPTDNAEFRTKCKLDVPNTCK